MIEPSEELEKHLFNVVGEILEQDKPSIWNVHVKGNMEKILEVDFQTFGIAVAEHTGQVLSDITTMTFYASVDYLKEKFKN